MAELDQTLNEQDNGATTPDSSVAEGTAQAPEEEEYIPIQQYNRVYGKLKERERELESYRTQAIAPAPALTPAPATSAPADPTADYLRKAMAPMMDPILRELRAVQPTLAEIKAERETSAFWGKAENQGYGDFREEVDQIYRQSVAGGYATSPDLILDALIGRQRRQSEAARREVATETIKRIKTVNNAARAETGGTASATRGPTDPNEMSTKDMEAQFGREVFYSRNRR